MIEYWPHFWREFLLLPYLVNDVALAVDFLSVTSPVWIVEARSFGWVEAERGGIVDEE
jgi:hypothetical protein